MTTKKTNPHQNQPAFSIEAVQELAISYGAAASDPATIERVTDGSYAPVYTLGNLADGEGYFSLGTKEEKKT